LKPAATMAGFSLPFVTKPQREVFPRFGAFTFEFFMKNHYKSGM
jgi:hypothetical protein